MAIVRDQPLPKCDVCGEMWLPDKILPGGILNPARIDPSSCKRCGKCKTPRWNYKERDKAAVASPDPPAAVVVKRGRPAGSKNKRCKHGLVTCPLCGGKD